MAKLIIIIDGLQENIDTTIIRDLITLENINKTLNEQAKGVSGPATMWIAGDELEMRYILQQ